MYHFCTYFDRNYLLRGLTAYRSLERTGCNFVLFVLALDDFTYKTLQALALPNLRPIPLETLEQTTPGLIEAKAGRSRIEYYFTLTPALPTYLLDVHTEIELITYIDADLHFHHSPAPIFEELGRRSILVCEHRYSPHLKRQSQYGHFNVQFQIFRRDAVGLACLYRWRDQCIEWCYDRIENGRYADQKYLDEWPSLYGDQLVIVQHPGVGLAPWNWASGILRLQGSTLLVDERALIFYHFHGFKIFNPHFISNGLSDWGLIPYRLRRWLYGGYLRDIRDSARWLHKRTGTLLPVKDQFIRGKGVTLSSSREIMRKAWSQAMFFS